MGIFWKATLAALSITAFAGAAGGANAQPYGYDNGRPGYDDRYDSGDPYAVDDNRTAANEYGYDGYGYDQPPGGVPYDYDTGGYCDAYGCPDDFYDLPVYYGPVYYGGSWFDGPLYYRDWYGRRQYWVHGGWHYDAWSGPRPSWYRTGTYGPALGLNFYRSNQFRSGFTQRGFADRGNFGRNDFNRPSFGNRQDFNRNDNRGFQNRGDFGATISAMTPTAPLATTAASRRPRPRCRLRRKPRSAATATSSVRMPPVRTWEIAATSIAEISSGTMRPAMKGRATMVATAAMATGTARM